MNIPKWVWFIIGVAVLIIAVLVILALKFNNFGSNGFNEIEGLIR